MIKENQKLFNRLNIISDAAVSFVAIIISYLFVFSLLEAERNYPLIDYIKLVMVFIPVQLITFGCYGLYDSHRTTGFTKELWRITQAFLIDTAILVAMLYIVKIINFSRVALAIFVLLDFFIIATNRFVLRKFLKHFRSSGMNKKYVLLIGSGDAAVNYLSVIRREKQMGFECVGYVANNHLLDAKYLGRYDQLFDMLDKHHYSEVVCALEAEELHYLGDVIEACEVTGTKISVIPEMYRYMSASPSIDMVGGIPMMNIRRIPLDNVGNAFMKRVMDIIGSTVLIVLTFPVMLVSGIIIKATMGGNVIFKQKRVGLNKKNFTMYKLKSMKDNVESETAWSTDNDPRKTRFGAFIRKFSIDELPQLFNVLKGDMSLVGPRPEIPYYVNNFKKTIPMYMLKHQVKPGMTGLAQIRGYRGDTSIEKRIECDIEYIENWNIFLDISILFQTAFSGFMNKEKLKKTEKNRKLEKLLMNKERQSIDFTALAIFFPSVVALAIVPILMQATMIGSDLVDRLRYFGGTELYNDGVYYLPDTNSQCKAFAVVVFALVMLAVAVICCAFMFRNAEKRTLVYTGSSVLFVLMSLASALGSDYQQTAFYGLHDRAEGFFTLACYFVMFLFTMYAFRKTQNFRYVVYALMVCTGGNFIIGLFQFTGNNLFAFDWFYNIFVDSEFRGVLELDKDGASFGSMYGALYHYNYVGSFAGMVIPLFTVLTISGKRIVHKIVYALFACVSLFMLFASTARSGIVALAVATVVGLLVFARVLIRRWKITVSVVGAVAVLAVGANIVMDNALFKRIPSLFQDAIELVVPAENTDMFSELAIREIKHNSDGTVSFVTQTDTLNVGYNAEQGKFTFADSSGEAVPLNVSDMKNVTVADEDFKDINMEIVCLDSTTEIQNALLLWFGNKNGNTMVFNRYSDNSIHMIDPNLGYKITPVNAEAFGFKGKEKLGSSRGYIWSRTIPLLKECLITGYGPDTYVYEFPQNDYLAKSYAYGEGMYITVDKPHNLYLQIFVNNGLIAFAAFLVICVYYLVDCFRLYALKKQYRTEQYYGISIMLAVVGYLTAGIFNDSVVAVAPVFWILLGVGVALNTVNRRIYRNQSVDVDEVVVEKVQKVDEVEMAKYEERAKLMAEKIAESEAAKKAEAERLVKELADKIRQQEARSRTITKSETEELLNRVRELKARKEAETAETKEKK